MKITTFFIDKFKEVSFTSPIGVQEEGGVYGDEPYYSSWILGQDGDSSDFVGITKTNILYGELYKITLDTGNDFNTSFVPRINDFMNMSVQEYWDNIVSGNYSFNGIKYSDFLVTRNQSIGLMQTPTGQQIPTQGGQTNVPSGLTAGGPTRATGRGGNTPGGGVPPTGGGGPTTGGGTPTTSATLLEYVMGVKERIGWVEVNRSRSSVYYQLCDFGKVATSNHFYDIDKFIMTAELFDPSNQTFVSNNILRPTPSFSYEKINPYSPQERYFTQSPSGASPKRIGLNPIDTWFTWNNNSQRHIKIYKGLPQNEPNSVIGGFTTFTWPMGNLWGQISVDPTDYLRALVTGNHIVLDGDANSQPIQKKIDSPYSLMNLVSDVSLITAQKEKHLNLLMDSRLVKQTQFGTNSPISSVYSVDIWGDLRIPQEVSTVKIGLISEIESPSIGDCQFVDGVSIPNDDSTELDYDISLKDPFGLELYDLEKSYQEIYSKYKFCPPRKKINNDLNKKYPFVVSKNKDSISRYNLNGETVIGKENSTNIVYMGAFNPDNQLLIDTDTLQISKKSDESSPYIDVIYNKREIIRDDASLFNENTQRFEDYVGFDISVSQSTFDGEDNNIIRDLSLLDMQNTFMNLYEVQNGIRDETDFLTTTPNVPYGTFKYKIDVSQNTDGSFNKTIKVKQNGSDADPVEFNSAISSIIESAKNNKTYPDPIGVGEDGMPIYPTNTLEESIKKITEELTGVKEIIFRGSDVNYGAISKPTLPSIYQDIESTQELFDLLTQAVDPIQYVNTGICVKGAVDINTGDQLRVSNFYGYRSNLSKFFNKETNSSEINKDIEDNILLGNIDFLGLYSKFDQKTFKTDKILMWHPNERQPIRVTPGLEESFWILNGWVPVPGSNIDFYYWDIGSMSSVTHLIISKVDVLGVSREFWARTEQNNEDTPIKSTSSGRLFFQTKGPNVPISDYIFDITGQVTEHETYYKVPVEFFGVSNGVANTPSRISNFLITYSKTKEMPSQQRTTTSAKNTFGGWVFNGLWHRDGSWPLDHTFRSGLLGTFSWNPCDGGVNTGAWIKIPDSRVRVELHNFSSDAYHTIYSYIHRKWLKKKDEIWKLENSISRDPSKVSFSDASKLSPFDEYSDSYIQFTKFQPDSLNGSRWERWEEELDNERNELMSVLKSYNKSVVVLSLRDNQSDPLRGLNSFEDMQFGSGEYSSPTLPGRFLEEWIYANSFDESKLDSRSNYSMMFGPEPIEHTEGIFKPNEWYKAIFVRAIVSPSNPSGQVASFKQDHPYDSVSNCKEYYQKKNKITGAYQPNDKNKKTICDLLYATEQVLKMQRQRLVDMKKYVDSRQDFYGQKNEEGFFINDSFNVSTKFVKVFRNLLNLYKK